MTPSTTTSPSPILAGHTILKGAEWVLAPETGLGVPDGIYGAQCMLCAEHSGLTDADDRPAMVWSMEHTRAHPDHRQYLVTARRHWRVDPAPRPAAQPAPPERLIGEAERPPPDRHVRPPRSRRRGTAVGARVARLGRLIGRLAGPAFLITVCLTAGVFIGATAVTP